MSRPHDSSSGARTAVLEATAPGVRAAASDDDASIPAERASAPAADLPEEARTQTGASIGRYVILGVVGAGGMGRVYRAYDPKLRREVALKLLLPEAHRRDRSADARLLLEAQAMARLSHPNVIAVFDVDAHEGGVYIAMEFVEGLDLRQWCQGGRKPWREVVSVFAAAGAGLAHAHAAGLVHRDFKPSNVLLGDDGRVRVMDFGLVRDVGDTADRSADDDNDATPAGASERQRVDDLTAIGLVMGTPAYMAPEHLAGKGADAKSDQYGYCIALWEALYGARPFGKEDLVLGRFAGPPPPPDNEVPAWLYRVLARGLATKPAERFVTMDALLLAMADDPRRRRIRWALAAAVPLSVLGIYGGMRVSEARAIDRCEQEGASIASSWNEERRQGMRTALQALQGDRAQDTAGRLQGWLDAYAQAWQEGRTRVCLATEVERQWGPKLGMAAADCFDERRAHLSGLVESLLEVDDAIATKAVATAANLPSLDACENETLVVQRVALPTDPEVRAAIVRIRGELARASGRAQLSKFEEALARVDELLLESESVQWPPLRAELEAAGARLTHFLAHYDDGIARGRTAFDIAFGAGHDEVAAEAATQLAYVLATERARFEEADVWVAVAQGIIERMGGASDLRQAKVAMIRGIIAEERGEPKTALPHVLSALSIQRGILGPDHPTIAITLTAIGGLRLSEGSPDLATQAHERALVITETAFGPEHPDVANILNNLAIVHAERGQYDAALARFERVLQIRRAAFGEGHPATAKALENIGLLFDQTSRFEEALAKYREAERVYVEVEGADHIDVASVVNNIGRTLTDLGRPAEAMAAYERALSIVEGALGKDHPRVAGVLNNIANLQADNDDHQGAIVAFERARMLLTASVGPDSDDVAVVLSNVGLEYMALDRFEDAKAAYQRSIAISTAVYGADHPALANTYDNFGLVLAAEGDYDAAFEVHERALRLRTSSVGERSPQLALSLTNMAVVRLEQDRAADALPLLQRAWDLQSDTDGAGAPHKGGTMLAMADALVDLGRAAEGLPFAEDAHAMASQGAENRSDLSVTKLLLAQVLWEAGTDPARARALAEASRELADADSFLARRTRARATAWLAGLPSR